MPDIVLKERVENIEDVDERLRGFYVEHKDGGFTVADVSGLLKNNRDLKAEKIALAEKHKGLEDDIAKFRALGDYEKLAELRAKQKDIETAQITNNAELDNWKRQYSATKDAETAAEREKRQRLESTMEKREVNSAVTESLSKAGVTAEGLEYLSKILAQDMKVFWEDGEPVVKVVDPKGQPRRNEALDPMTIDELVAAHRKRVPHFFRSPGGSGGSSTGAEDAGAVEFDNKPSKWPPERLKAYLARYGHENYRALYAKEAAAARQGGA